MEKPKVFVSHIPAEKDLAILMKETIAEATLGLLDVFVSSDGESIHLGTQWLATIDAQLKSAQAMLVMCSQASVGKPWINFEAGAGWVKGIEVIPICHTGMRPIDLPVPLSMLQGVEASDSAGIHRVVELLGRKLARDVRIPKRDYTEFVGKVRDIERKYGVIRELKECVDKLEEILPDLKQVFNLAPKASAIQGNVLTSKLSEMRPYLSRLKSRGYIDFSINEAIGIFVGEESGTGQEIRIQVLDSYYKIAPEIRGPAKK